MSSVNVPETVLKYESIMNDVLREDLRHMELRLQQINAEITDLIQQKHTLKVVTSGKNNSFKTQVNVGCNFFMEASVTDTSKVLFNVGLNHYLELTIPEVNKVLDVRIAAFEEKANEIRDKCAATKAHIKLLLLGIGQLKGETPNHVL